MVLESLESRFSPAVQSFFVSSQNRMKILSAGRNRMDLATAGRICTIAYIVFNRSSES